MTGDIRRFTKAELMAISEADLNTYVNFAKSTEAIRDYCMAVGAALETYNGKLSQTFDAIMVVEAIRNAWLPEEAVVHWYVSYLSRYAMDYLAAVSSNRAETVKRSLAIGLYRALTGHGEIPAVEALTRWGRQGEAPKPPTEQQKRDGFDFLADQFLKLANRVEKLEAWQRSMRAANNV